MNDAFGSFDNKQFNLHVFGSFFMLSVSCHFAKMCLKNPLVDSVPEKISQRNIKSVCVWKIVQVQEKKS